MSKHPMMPLWPDALVADTMHLSTEEFGAYALILIATWRNNGEPLADDDRDLAHICRMSVSRWRRHFRGRLAGFFDLSQKLWRQKRLEKEWENAELRAEVSRANGKAGGRPTKPSRIPAGFFPETQQGTQQGTQTKPRAKATRTIDSYSSLKDRDSKPRARAREGNGHLNGEDQKNGNGSFSSLRSPAASPPLKETRKELLRMKLMRFAHATMNDAKRRAAFLGLMGEDPEHSAQWWLDTLDLAMRAQHWDDRE